MSSVDKMSAARLKASGMSQSRRRRGSHKESSLLAKSRNGMSGSQTGQAGPRRLQPDPQNPALIIYDDHGRDVTPKSLINVVTSDGSTGLSVGDSSVVSADLNANGAGGALSSIGVSTGMESDSVTINSSAAANDSSFSESFTTSDARGHMAPMANANWNGRGAEASESVAESVPERKLTAEELRAPTTIFLVETETFFWVDMEGECVGLDSQAEHREVTAANKRFEDQVEAKREGPDNYANRSAQTLGFEPKNKEAQTLPRNMSSVGSQADSYDMHDSAAGHPSAEARAVDQGALAADPAAASSLMGAVAGAAAKGANPTGPQESHSQSLASMSNVNQSMVQDGPNASTSLSASAAQSQALSDEGLGTLSLASGASLKGAAAKEKEKERRLAAVLASQAFGDTARCLENMALQNVYHTLHLKYRDVSRGIDLPPSTLFAANAADEGTTVRRKAKDRRSKRESVEAKPGALELLWTFRVAATEGKTVSCVAFSSASPDLIAAAYGESTFGASKGGLVAFWSLRNPEFPSRQWAFESGVTAIAFSVTQPFLIAVGQHNGMVSVHDIRSDSARALSEANRVTGKHAEAVWSVRWVKRPGGDERLYAVSTDGFVTQWAIKKGLERTDAMRLKRMAGAPGSGLGRSFQGNSVGAGAGAGADAAATGGEGIVSRRASAFSIDFSPLDPSVYLCGAPICRRVRDGAAMGCP